jgi:hypothetical protein
LLILSRLSSVRILFRYSLEIDKSFFFI